MSRELGDLHAYSLAACFTAADGAWQSQAGSGAGGGDDRQAVEEAKPATALETPSDHYGLISRFSWKE